MQLSDWQFKERVASGNIGFPQANALSIDVPIQLAERRIYLYLETKVTHTGGQNVFEAAIEAWKAGQKQGEFPACIADSDTVYQTKVTLFNAGDPPVGDSAHIWIANPWKYNTATLQPLRINAEIDQLRLNIRLIQGSTVAGWRACLGCLSTQY